MCEDGHDVYSVCVCEDGHDVYFCVCVKMVTMCTLCVCVCVCVCRWSRHVLVDIEGCQVGRRRAERPGRKTGGGGGGGTKVGQVMGGGTLKPSSSEGVEGECIPPYT